MTTRRRYQPSLAASPPISKAADQRASALDWQSITASLSADGYAILPSLLSADECATLSAIYSSEEPLHSRVMMAHHGFGSGEYKYFSYPLPELISRLRTALYSRLCSLANHWNGLMNVAERYPYHLETYLERCHRSGQRRPTALLLQYGEGDYNCLHQDLYVEHAFPLQAAFLLSKPGRDFTGGEFVLMEQRPRMQSRATVVQLDQGTGVIFAVNNRPVQGMRGSYRVKLRHGVSEVRSGYRRTLGILFHDAR
jgi:uncharacterized protein